MGVIVAAYACVANLPEDDVRWLHHQLHETPGVDGFEIPVLDRPIWRDTAFWASPESGQGHILTLTPALRAISDSGDAGLAAKDEDARRRAVDVVRTASEWVATVNGLRPGSIGTVTVIAGPKPARADLDALRRSLEEVAAIDWSGAAPMLEHCDAERPDHPPAKGFLELVDELSVLPAEVGLLVNWGRSAIEGRSADYVTEQIASAAHRITGLTFSGASAAETPLGAAWADRHTPMREVAEVDPALRFCELSLLGAPEIAAAYAALADAPHPVLIGLKIKPEETLPVDIRLAALRRGVEAVAR